MRSKHSILLITGLLVAYAVLMDYSPFRRVEEGQWSRGAAKQGRSEHLATRGAVGLEGSAGTPPVPQRRPSDILQSNRSSKLWDPAAVRTESGSQGSNESLCKALKEPSTRSIAVVGNGPLKMDQRAKILEHDKVVRFNTLNNRLPGERMDLWVVRHNYKMPRPYWGFSLGMTAGEIERAVEEAGAVFFLGGDSQKSELVIEKFPSLKDRSFQASVLNYQLLYTSFFTDSEQRNGNSPDPSSGLLGLLFMLGCAGHDTAVHIYGFNWSAKNYFTHKMEVEELIVRKLADTFNVTIHATACQGLRSCEELCDRPDFKISKEGDGAECRKRRDLHALFFNQVKIGEAWNESRARKDSDSRGG